MVFALLGEVTNTIMDTIPSITPVINPGVYGFPLFFLSRLKQISVAFQSFTFYPFINLFDHVIISLINLTDISTDTKMIVYN